jgi:diaminohydroxyphosphoribosylaminopyrimidine deaminase/5-amino-6-(5-phosphoribosylamino)uracil reductase
VDLNALLDELGRRRVISVLVEGGGEVLGSFFQQRLIDELAAFVAPRLVGGSGAPGPIGGPGVEQMADACEIVDVTYERVGRDILVRGRPRFCPEGGPCPPPTED